MGVECVCSLEQFQAILARDRVENRHLSFDWECRSIHWAISIIHSSHHHNRGQCKEGEYHRWLMQWNTVSAINSPLSMCVLAALFTKVSVWTPWSDYSYTSFKWWVDYELVEDLLKPFCLNIGRPNRVLPSLFIEGWDSRMRTRESQWKGLLKGGVKGRREEVEKPYSHKGRACFCARHTH